MSRQLAFEVIAYGFTVQAGTHCHASCLEASVTGFEEAVQISFLHSALFSSKGIIFLMLKMSGNVEVKCVCVVFVGSFSGHLD